MHVIRGSNGEKTVVGNNKKQQQLAEKVHGALTGRKVYCTHHGDQQWSGHIICEKCQKLYKYDPVDMPDYCSCGIRLRPDAAGVPGVVFSARIVCAKCVEKLLAIQTDADE